MVFMAIEEGKITLDKTIDSFFPELKNSNKITIAHLLHHQSGILSYTKDNYFWENREKEQAPKDLLNAIQKLEQNFEPGRNTAYSNSGYFLLGQILEEVYKESYQNLLHKKIIEPLGLKNTYIVHNIQLDKNESFSYVYNKTKWEKFPETNLSLAKAAGSITSSPKDLNIFFRNLLNGKLVSESSLEHMKTIVRRHGMGLFRYKIHDQTGYGHGGNIDGFNSSAIYFKDIDVAIAITSNGAKTSINEVFSKVFEFYLGDVSHPISEEELAIYEGTYYDIKDNSDTSVFERKNDTLILVIKGEFRQPLKYKGDRRFLFNQMYGEQISFTFSEDGKEMLFEQGKYKGKYEKKD
jgi:D-alanyl-D-alanine carboxypeptidase